jgi:hypothetical protein
MIQSGAGPGAKTMLAAISEDRALGSAVLFNHRHENESPDFHVTICDLWRCGDEFVMIEVFREGAKTTLSEEFLLMEAAFGNFAYAVVFGETYAKACQKIEAISHEAKTNIKLRQIFGEPLAKKPIENKIWFRSGALIEAAGWEQEITGFKHHDRRPDRAYLDDVENLERVRDSSAVDATMRKLYREVLPALDKVRRKVRVTQTPRAADCLVTRLRSNPDWLCASFPIANGDLDSPLTVSAWPSRYPISWIRAERDRFTRAGMLRQFQQEYMLSVDDAASKPFADDMIKAIDVAPAAWLPRVAIYDPSRTANPTTSDRVGKVVVSRLAHKFIVHESAGHFWKPDETRNDIFTTAARHHCAEIGIEKNSLDEYLLQPLRHEMIRRDLHLTIRALNAPQDRSKDQFIMGLQPFFAAGDILLVGGKGMHGQLVAEIQNFPAGKRDILNALAYSLRMFAGSPVYEDFGEANVGPAPEPARGETIYLAWNASANETVCAALIKNARHWSVFRDQVKVGPTVDAVTAICAELRSDFPRAIFEAYVPAELHDAWSRIPLVAALRNQRLMAWRGEHISVARGALADLVRTTIRDRRLLTVSKDAPTVLNALAMGYKYPVSTGGKQSHEPEPGVPRLMAEALETTIAALSRTLDRGEETANYANNATGARYMTALPRRN